MILSWTSNSFLEDILKIFKSMGSLKIHYLSDQVGRLVDGRLDWWVFETKKTTSASIDIDLKLELS